MSAVTYVNIAEMAVSDRPDDLLVAPNLGSCLGVAIYDPRTRLGGLVHCLLPLSQSDPEKARQRPLMYVDTGVAALLTELLKRGAQKRDLEIIVAGGSAINDASSTFEIGKRNFTVLRKLLWKNNLLIKAHDIAGEHPRTVSLAIESGRVMIRARGEMFELVNQKHGAYE